MSATSDPLMTRERSVLPRASRRGEPTWEVALLFPAQGDWSEEDYLALQTNRLVELSDGCLDVHQELYDPIPPMKSQPGTPAWELALLLPFQGEWTEAEYLALSTNRLVELSDGCLEVLPMPEWMHQLIMKYLLYQLDAFVTTRNLGMVGCSPLPVQLGSGKYREPDIIFVSPARFRGVHGKQEGADLVMEIVSGSYEDRKRDLETKRREYAQAGIAEYWIVDPETKLITVLILDGQSYREHGAFGVGSQATSVLLSGFTVNVEAVFAAGQGNQSQ